MGQAQRCAEVGGDGRADVRRRAPGACITYTVIEAAEILQFHPDAIRYWLRVGELEGEIDPEQPDPDGWAIHPEALVAFLRQNGEMMPGDLPADRAPAAISSRQLARQTA